MAVFDRYFLCEFFVNFLYRGILSYILLLRLQKKGAAYAKCTLFLQSIKRNGLSFDARES